MKLRTVNQELLKQLIKKAGGFNKAAEKIGKSRTLLGRLVHGNYKRTLKETSRLEICEGLGTSEGELFPFVEADEEAS